LYAAVVVVCLVGVAAPARADVVPHRVTADTDRIDIAEHLYVIEDPEGELQLADVRAEHISRGFEQVAHETPNFGFSSSAFWFHFALEGNVPATEQRMLQLGYALLDRVEVYVEQTDGSFATHITGDSLPYAERPLDHTTFVFPVTVTPDTTTRVFIRVTTDGSVQVPLVLWARDAFVEHDHRRQMAMGAVYGVLLVMLLYNLFLFFTIRDRSYAYYVGFVLMYGLSQACLDGIAYQYLWPGSPDWNSIALPMMICGDAIVALLFLREFLDPRTSLRRWDKIVVGLILFGAVAVLAAAVLDYAVSIRVTAVYAMTGAAVSLAVGVLALRGGNRAARFFVVAWAFFLIGVVILVLSKFGVLPRVTITEHGPRIGSLLQVIALSLALADRINAIKAETEAAQRQALEIQTEATENLQAEVAKRTHELEVQNAMLEENADKLAALDVQKTHFFQNVSHELRTPLTLILTPLEQLQSDVRFRNDGRIDLATKNARRLLRLVNQLLDFQKLSAGKREIQAVPIDLVPFLSACGEHVIPTASKRGIEYVYRVDGQEPGSSPEPIVVAGEIDAIEKVIFNFLSNAVKYTPEGGRIELLVETDQPNVDFARISVRDTGPGISDEDREQLFEVFSQVDTEHAHLGTGLGLALARELTEAMGGAVGVESEVGKGSTFWASLPMTEAPKTQKVRAPSSGLLPGWELDDTGVPLGADNEETTDHGDYDGGILVIDDVPDMRKLIRSTLGAYGFDTFAASNGINGLRAAKEWKPSLIVTDWMMPGLTGPEFIEKLRQDTDLATTPVVLLTAKSDDESRLLGTKAGADAFLGKPFNEDELVSVVQNLLQLKRRERQVERLNDQLSASNESLLHAQHQRKRLASFIVHDLKNPLTVIGVNLEFISDEDDLSDLTTESVRGAMAATETMERMVLNLLDIHRSEDGALEANRDDVDVPAMIGEVCRHMSTWARDRGQSVSVDVDLDHDRVRIDPDLVRRVLANLFDNCLKYAPPGGDIAVSARTVEPGVIEIRVADEGPGVPAEDRERIFDAYQQLERDRRKHLRTSRGLGLVFCRLAAEAHGGTVWVEDNDPQGSCFCVQLLAPVATSPRSASARRASTPSLQ
jgi:signal transduction histidine kinase